MQYTWLKDKNWLEIFEGDIVKYGFKGEIIWDWKWMLQWQDNDREPNYHYNEISHWKHAINPWELEVIGNIYENPELINSHR